MSSWIIRFGILSKVTFGIICWQWNILEPTSVYTYISDFVKGRNRDTTRQPHQNRNGVIIKFFRDI